MSSVLLGQSYYLHFDPKLWKAMQPYPPLGTLYAASLMRQQGVRVALFDAMLASSEDEWAEALKREKPRFAVLFEDNFNYLSKMCLGRMRKAAFVMIKAARQAGCTVIVSGADASDHFAEYLKAGADFVIRGEGELTLNELIAHLSGKSPGALSDIPGIIYMESGKTVITLPRPAMRDLDSLPFPAWDLVDVQRYQQIWRERHGYYSMNMVTTRGCPYHCNWCAKPIWGQRYNSRSPENVAAEMYWLKKVYQPDHIWFADDIFGLKPGWLQQFADAVEANDVRIPFKCLSRADLLIRTPEIIPALKRAGCQIVWMGAESGSQKILNAMEKGTTVEQIGAAVRALHSAGISAALFLQFGYPGETWDDVQATLRIVRQYAPDDVGMSVSYPLPGTKFYESVQVQLGDKQNWVDSADLAMMYQGPFSTEFYRQLHVVLHKEFRSRRSWRALRSALPARVRLHHLRDAAASMYRLITLPFARLRLRVLAVNAASRLVPPAHMTLEEASLPSPQIDGQS